MGKGDSIFFKNINRTDNQRKCYRNIGTYFLKNINRTDNQKRKCYRNIYDIKSKPQKKFNWNCIY